MRRGGCACCVQGKHGACNPQTQRLSHLQQFEHFFKDTFHVGKEGHTVDKHTPYARGLQAGFSGPGKG